MIDAWWIVQMSAPWDYDSSRHFTHSTFGWNGLSTAPPLPPMWNTLLLNRWKINDFWFHLPPLEAFHHLLWSCSAWRHKIRYSIKTMKFWMKFIHFSYVSNWQTASPLWCIVAFFFTSEFKHSLYVLSCILIEEVIESILCDHINSTCTMLLSSVYSHVTW